jgi:hypothetical protein
MEQDAPDESELELADGARAEVVDVERPSLYPRVKGLLR